ncbi:SDR family NAD(P)-dependent oxidoreductase [Micromonospora sp. DT48]|uniref:SDR family NAD(P)-dependent oxidoreductase n=1 Tax=Micromonospora sp. DT48 TaxID=3393429 RepID=UPI003CF9FFD6
MPRSMAHMFRDSLTAREDSSTYRFLDDGEGQPNALLDRELDRRARALAVALLARFRPGDRVILACPSGPDYLTAFIGCLYAGVVAVPAYPIEGGNSARSLSKLHGIAADCQAAALLVPQTSPEQDAMYTALDSVLATLPRIGLQEVTADPDDWREPDLDGDDIAFLQYTSGSTGQPKGVMVTHGNLLANLACIDRTFFPPEVEGRHMVTWLPPFHDMGLIGGLLEPAFGRFPVTVMDPMSFLKRPVRWLRAVSDMRASISGGPNFAYELCLSKVTPADLEQLDLSSWDVAFNGAEPVKAATMERFTSYFAPTGFRSSTFFPCYGLAENTLMATASRRLEDPVVNRFDPSSVEEGQVRPSEEGRDFVSSGLVGAGGDLAIVDPDTAHRCPDGQVGEIWLHGPCVARGYWGRPEEDFVSRIDGDERAWFRTGDLGFVLDGELYVTGRIKDLVIVNGRNVHAHDIESSLAGAHPALRPGVAVCQIVEDDSGRLLVVNEVLKAPEPEQAAEIVAAIRRVVSREHDLAVDEIALVRRGGILKTSSGKTRRRAIASAYLRGELAAVHTWSRGGAQTSTDTPATATADRTPAGAPATAATGTPASAVADRRPDPRELTTWLREQVAAAAKVSVGQVDVGAPLAELGLGSSDLVGLAGSLETRVGTEVPATLLWEYPTIEAVVGHYCGTSSASSAEQVNRPSGSAGEPIAVVGMACRFPGAPDLDGFWDLLTAARDAITEVPADRWDVDELYDPTGATPGSMRTRWGGFVDGVADFDADFFGISPREAAEMDPQQRMFLEVAWEALEDAGIRTDDLAGSRTGVFVGAATSDHAKLATRDLASITAFTGTGNAASIIANRLSYLLDLRGPSMTLDTACSSSLVALHQACESLASGTSSMAVAGGVNVILGPELAVNFSRAGAMAADGRCKTFSAAADGYVRSEGCGVVVLKPLSRAIADGDRIYATVLGSAVNQDGRTNGLMAPSSASQKAVLRDAYAAAGVAPDTVELVEAHGTGTLLGDPIEVSALAEVLTTGRSADNPLLVGSVKSNIGHLEAAAGVAGFIKAALALHRGSIPASLHFDEPNQHIDFEGLRVDVVTEARKWPGSGPRHVAGVSSFGFGGTNAHAVLATPPVQADQDLTQAGGPLLLPLSARDDESLRRLAGRYASILTSSTAAQARAICGAAARRRTAHPYRAVGSAGSVPTLAAMLRTWSRGQDAEGVSTRRASTGGPTSTVAVFPGQGSRWWPLAADLLDSGGAFEETLHRADAWCRQHLDWSLLEDISMPDGGQLARSPRLAQPALVATQVALASWLVEHGVQIGLVVGHSVGEISAACVAGALDLEVGLRIAAARGEAIESSAVPGAMAMVALDAEETRKRLEGMRRSDLWISAENGPGSTILSGSEEAVAAWLAAAEEDGLFSRSLAQVTFASHCPMMDTVLPAFRTGMGEVSSGPTRIPMLSTVLGRVVDGDRLGTDYWLDNLRQPVLFDSAIRAALEQGWQRFTEIAMHPALTRAIQDRIDDDQVDAAVIETVRRDSPALPALWRAVGEAFCSGADIDWDAVYTGRRMVDLPVYPWNHDRHLGVVASRAAHVPSGGHPIVHTVVEAGAEPGLWLGVGEVAVDRLPWLADHQVAGAAVLPATAILDALLATARTALSRDDIQLEEVELASMVPIGQADEPATQVRIVLRDRSGKPAEAELLWRRPDAAVWTPAARSRVADAVSLETPPVEVAQDRRTVAPPRLYATFAAVGIDYGDAFRGIRSAWAADGASGGTVAHEEGWRSGPHPAELDACLQLAAAGLVDTVQTGPRVPVRVGGFSCVPVSEGDLDVVCVGSPTDGYRIEVRDQTGRLVARLEGLELSSPGRHDEGLPLHQVTWEEATDQAAGQPSAPGHWVVVSAGETVDARVASLLADRSTTVVPQDLDRARLAEFLRAESQQHGAAIGVVHALALADPADDDARHGLDLVGSLVTVAQAMRSTGPSAAASLVVLTAGAQEVRGQARSDSGPAALWGAARTLVVEAPELGVRLVDLPDGPDGAAGPNLDTFPSGTEAAWRKDRWWVPRLRRFDPEDPAGWPLRTLQTGRERDFRLLAKEPGDLASLAPFAFGVATPAAGEVLIDVRAAGLNFNDVLKALGSCPGVEPGRVPLGAECSGVVAAVGEGVTRVRVGDPVMAVAASSFSGRVVAPEALVARLDAQVDLTEAAGVPIAFLTAAYALEHMARLAPGETVLIHSAAGGVGLAAMQIARRCGATILATAGTAEKRELLASLGAAHVYDSRSLDFADQVRADTQGKGVDVVLNSLAGEALRASLALLAENGRFVEIGKRDIYDDSSMGLSVLARNRSFMAVDLEALFNRRPAAITPVLDAVARALGAGELTPVRTNVFPMAQATEAFTTMARAKHIGKIVLVPDGVEDVIVAPGAAPVRRDASYVITGGLGDLGLEAARSLAERGAGRLVLLSRSEPAEAARTRLDEITRTTGADIVVASADVGDADALAAVVARAGAGGLPVRGVVHAAGVLADAALDEQDAASLRRVWTAKARGVVNLARACEDADLDFFVTYSSAAGVLGSPGQLNYAAANAFVDAWGRGARRRGVPVVNLVWGPWGEIGLASRQGSDVALARLGLKPIDADLGRAVFDTVTDVPAEVVVLPIDAAAIAQMSADDLPGLLSGHAGAGFGGADLDSAVSGLADELLSLPPGRARRAAVVEACRNEVAAVLRSSPEAVASSRPFSEMGFDSLMSLELRKRLQRLTGVSLPSTVVWRYPNVDALAEQLAAAMGVDLGSQQPARVETEPEPQTGPDDDLADLSEDELENLLRSTLHDLENSDG